MKASRSFSRLAGLLLFLLGFGTAQAAEDCAYSCSESCRQTLAYWQQVIDLNAQNCDGGGRRCIANCTARFASGQCSQYGQDYCGYGNIACVARCTARFASGQCSQWAADVCGRNAACTPNCTSRWSNGQCSGWGPDTCGAQP